MTQKKVDPNVRAILKDKQELDRIAAWLLASDLPVAEKIRRQLRLPQSRTMTPVATKRLHRYLFEPNIDIVQLAKTSRDYPLPPLPH